MINEGIYALTFKGGLDNAGAVTAAGKAPADVSEHGEALAILRNGRILGSDRWGGMFSGTYEFDVAAGQNKVLVRIDVPPGGELITGFSAGPRGASFDIVAAFDRTTPRATTTVEVAGTPIEVEFSFLGPCPLGR